MITLSAKIRKDLGRKNNSLRDQGMIPAVVYGPGEKNISLELNYADFQKVFKEAGESSLIELKVEGEKEKKLVLVHEIQKDPVSDKFIHIDFFQASLKEETEVMIPLVFEGEAPAVKDLGGTLVKNFSEIEVKALPQNLPHEIKIDISGLKNFGDHILIKDIKLPNGVTILKKSDEIVVSVPQPVNVEEELAKEIEEKVEDVEKVEKPKKEEEVVEDVTSEKK